MKKVWSASSGSTATPQCSTEGMTLCAEHRHDGTRVIGHASGWQSLYETAGSPVTCADRHADRGASHTGVPVNTQGALVLPPREVVGGSPYVYKHHMQTSYFPHVSVCFSFFFWRPPQPTGGREGAKQSLKSFLSSSKIETLSLSLQPRFRNYRMKLIADAESARSGHAHVTSQPAFFTPFRDPGGMLSRSMGMPNRNDRPPSIWDTHVFRETFL